MVSKRRAKLHNSQNVKKEDAFASFFVVSNKNIMLKLEVLN